MRTREIMRSVDVLQTVQSSETLADTARKMRGHKVSALPVVDKDRRVVGMISERDVINRYQQESTANDVKTLQTPLAWLASEGSAKDVGRLAESFSAVGRTKVGEVMTKEVVKVGEEDSVGTLLQQMAEHNINHIPVVNGEKLTGLVARGDVVSALSKLAKDHPESF